MGTIHLSTWLARSWVIVASLALTAPAFSQLAPVQPVAPARSTSYGKLPLSFEANQGQSDGRVKFLARGQGYGLFLTPTEAVLSLRAQHDEQTNRTAVVRMRLVGANPRPQLTGLDLQTGKSNYFVGNDPAQWRSDVPNYARVKYAQVYPGIDLIYHGNQRQLEYDFVVAPGADPKRIELAFKGVDSRSLDAEGNLVLATTHGKILQHKPVVYQDIDGQRKLIESGYVLRGRRRAAFRISRYDTSRPLVIDPVLVYSTYLGGSQDDSANGIAIDGGRNVYITGSTESFNFPTCESSGCPAPLYPGQDVFITKLNAAGSALLYSTFIGGSLREAANAIAVDANGNTYITGYTLSNDFPMVGGIMGPNVAGSQSDAFVTKLNAAGNALLYSTYLGGSGTGGFGNDVGNAIAVDSSGSAYVTGITSSDYACTDFNICDAGHGIQGCIVNSSCATFNFPITANAFQKTRADEFYAAFVSKLSADGSTLVYSTFLGGNGHDEGNGIAVSATGDAYVSGMTYSTNFPGATSSAIQNTLRGINDAFLVKLNATGTGLAFSTYLGGTAFDGADAIALDGSSNAYITGYTSSADFPGAGTSTIQSTNHGGFEDAFVAKVNAGGTTLMYATYLGGNGRGDTISFDDIGLGIAVDTSGAAYVAGQTLSADFPVVNEIQNSSGGSYDAWVARVNPAGSALLYSTYLGGGGFDFGRGIAVDSSGNAYVCGHTNSGDFPTASPFQAVPAGWSDAFVAKISPLTATTTTLNSSLNPSAYSDSVTFTATVSGTGVTGTVQFMDSNANLGPPVALSSGVASYMTAALSVGTHPITAVYSGDSTYLTSTSAVVSQVVLPPFGAPSGLIAVMNPFSVGIVMVELTWSAVSGVDHYEVARSSNNGAYATIASAFFGPNYVDFGPLAADRTYLYKVRAVAAGGTMSGYSNVDPATTVFFTDDPLFAGSTTVKAAHVNELRTAANAMRAAAGLTTATFTDPSLTSSTIIRAVHMQQIRTALDAARLTLLLPTLVYTEGTLTPMVSVIKAAFVQQMRNGTK